MMSTSAPRPDARIRVLHEDGDLLVVDKPAGLVCHPTKGDVYSSLISRLRLHRGGGEVHLVHRLDRETSGVSVAALSVAAARELGRVFESRSVRKCYLAIVHGHPSAEDGVVEAPLGKAEGSPVVIQDAVRPDGSEARTRWRLVERFRNAGEPFAVLEVEPETGRKHQIRIHLAHVGHPIVGDKLYGGDPGCYLRFVTRSMTQADREVLRVPCQALHAATLGFGWRGVEWAFRAEPEPWFQAFRRGEAVTAGWSDEPGSGTVEA